MFEYPGFDISRRFRVVNQEFLGIFAPLADAFFAVGEPGTALLDNIALNAQVDQVTFF